MAHIFPKARGDVMSDRMMLQSLTVLSFVFVGLVVALHPVPPL